MQLKFGFVVLASALFFCPCPQYGVVAAEPDNSVEKRLFAVEIKIGPNWDTSIAPREQAFFTEHSAHLKTLRQAGHIVMGARYSDIGLLVFTAQTADAVAALMDQDPSMQAGTFVFEVHTFNVFYPGPVGMMED